MRIGLDIDGVVYDWEGRARKILAEEFGVDLPLSSEWDSIKNAITPEQWNWLWTTGVTGQPALFMDGDKYPGASDGVEMLSDIGDVVIITKVPRVAIQDRIFWLSHNGIPFDEFRTVGSLSDKSLIVPLCDVYIDDSSEVADDILEHTNAKMILWNRPWNMGINAPKSRKQYWRVDCWDEVATLCGIVKELYA